MRVLLQAQPLDASRSPARPARASAASKPTPSTRRRASGPNVVLRSASGPRARDLSRTCCRVSGGDTVRLLGRAGNGVRNGLYRGSLEIRTAAGAGPERDQHARHRELRRRASCRRRARRSGRPRRSQAQAVAARTYALATGVSGKGFDQYPDTRSQVYRGFGAETATTNNAVATTARRGRHLRRRAVVTYFFSTSGGHTENVENVFAGSDPKPWLKGVERSLRRRLALSPLGARTLFAHAAARRQARQLRQGALPQARGAQARGLAARRARAGDRLARQRDRHRPAAARRGSACATPGSTCAGVDQDRAAPRPATSSGTRALAAIYGRVDPSRGPLRGASASRSTATGRRSSRCRCFARRDGGAYRFHVGERGPLPSARRLGRRAARRGRPVGAQV